MTTGSHNNGLGLESARYLADGTTAATIYNNSNYIGASTKVSANGVTNENVFGHNATGNGSNSMTLGDDNITKTVLKGNVGIGTTAPAEKLVVNGNIRVSNLTASQLLASDANKNIVSLSTANYPSLQELGYIKGVTDSVQNQLNLIERTVKEVPTFVSDGVYQTSVQYVANTTELYVNGIMQIINDQYTESGQTVILAEIPLERDKILIKYKK